MTPTISPSLENYLEAILIVQLEKDRVQVKDVAQCMKVRPPSALEALEHLQKKGLVAHERYGSVRLTSRGLTLAKKIYHRHTTLLKFLHEVLDIDAPVAEEDACKIEHYVSKKTIERIVKFIQFVEACPESKPICLENFYSFLKNNAMPTQCSSGRCHMRG